MELFALSEIISLNSGPIFRDVGAGGSNPLSPTNFFLRIPIWRFDKGPAGPLGRPKADLSVAKTKTGRRRVFANPLSPNNFLRRFRAQMNAKFARARAIGGRARQAKPAEDEDFPIFSLPANCP